MNLATEHLLLRLRPLHRCLRQAVARRAAVNQRTVASGNTSTGVTAEDASLLLDHLDARVRDEEPPPPGLSLEPPEALLEQLLFARAKAEQVVLPLESLGRSLALDEQETTAILCAVAPEIDPSYELVYGYVVDDLTRKHASAELIRAVLAAGVRAEIALRDKLGPTGRLQRLGLLEERQEPAATERHRVLRPTSTLLAFLLSGGDPQRLFVDPFELDTRAGETAPPGVDRERLQLLARGLGERVIDVVGVWGGPATARSDAIVAMAYHAGMRLRRLDPARVERSFEMAAASGAILWCDLDAVASRDELLGLVVAEARRKDATLCFTSEEPTRPLPLVMHSSFAELWLAEPDCEERTAMWRAALPELGELPAASLATRVRLDPARVRAAARIARTSASLEGGEPRHSHVESALATVTRSEGTRFTTLIEPRRTKDDLVLPEATHRSVMEVATFFRGSAFIGDHWGMGSMLTGGGGIKALFTGDSGTGKTLAAEVIAGELGLPLLRVELARIMSKWIGETEQHLEVAFHEAEANHAVLFFDEADALFGKRGQVQRGADRYANLEVSYLLQRLEDYAGVAVLATNLRENIDAAFTRRFQVLVHFPRPTAAERARIWRRAFPAKAPVEESVDLELLARLDMTGAGIVASARTAALLAAQRGDAAIGMATLVAAVARQYQREARILTPRDLGPYASMLGA